jgi:hypothetical protein
MTISARERLAEQSVATSLLFRTFFWNSTRPFLLSALAKRIFDLKEQKTAL